MNRRQKIGVWAAIIFIVLMVAGCAAILEEEEYARLNRKLKPMISCSKADFLLRFGPPNEKSVEGDIEVWRYSKYYGNRYKGKSTKQIHGDLFDATSIRQYNIIDVFFKQDKMFKYKLDVQR
ncbi:hypothetical protein ACFLQW_02950 [Candidatus Zixiibacteriota bacterium]